jgi:hypothetical protein
VSKLRLFRTGCKRGLYWPHFRTGRTLRRFSVWTYHLQQMPFIRLGVPRDFAKKVEQPRSKPRKTDTRVSFDRKRPPIHSEIFDGIYVTDALAQITPDPDPIDLLRLPYERLSLEQQEAIEKLFPGLRLADGHYSAVTVKPAPHPYTVADPFGPPDPGDDDSCTPWDPDVQ